MTSSRFILGFLGIIFIMIVILSARSITLGIRDRFTNIFRRATPTPTRTVPTPTMKMQLSPTPASPQNTSGGTTKGGQRFTNPPQVTGMTSGNQIPATGPSEIAWLVMSGGMLSGYSLRRFSKRK